MLPRNKPGEILLENDFAYVVVPYGGDPQTRRMIVLRQHVTTEGLVTPAEWMGVMGLVEQVRLDLQEANGGGCTFYRNDGDAAGQESEHLHFHVVSRPENVPTAGMGVAALLDHCEVLAADRKSLEAYICRE